MTSGPWRKSERGCHWTVLRWDKTLFKYLKNTHIDEEGGSTEGKSKPVFERCVSASCGIFLNKENCPAVERLLVKCKTLLPWRSSRWVLKARKHWMLEKGCLYYFSYGLNHLCAPFQLISAKIPEFKPREWKGEPRPIPSLFIILIAEEIGHQIIHALKAIWDLLSLEDGRPWFLSAANGRIKGGYQERKKKEEKREMPGGRTRGWMREMRWFCRGQI